MTSKRLTADVCVQLTVNVSVGNWDASCSFEGLQEQADREARNKLSKILEGKQCKILGTPGVMAVTIKEMK